MGVVWVQIYILNFVWRPEPAYSLCYVESGSVYLQTPGTDMEQSCRNPNRGPATKKPPSGVPGPLDYAVEPMNMLGSSTELPLAVANGIWWSADK